MSFDAGISGIILVILLFVFWGQLSLDNALVLLVLGGLLLSNLDPSILVPAY